MLTAWRGSAAVRVTAASSERSEQPRLRLNPITRRAVGADDGGTWPSCSLTHSELCIIPGTGSTACDNSPRSLCQPNHCAHNVLAPRARVVVPVWHAASRRVLPGRHDDAGSRRRDVLVLAQERFTAAHCCSLLSEGRRILAGFPLEWP